MEKLPSQIEDEILEMEQQDLALTKQLDACGELQKYGYHPQLERQHKANSARLQEIINRYGFPTQVNRLPQVHQAAWRIVQHAIGEPDFMRYCHYLFRRFSLQEIPMSSRAYLEDRIAFYERRPQKFGTQFDCGLDGVWNVWWLADAVGIEKWRKRAGLPPLDEVRQRFQDQPVVSRQEAWRIRQQQEQWLLKTGWCREEEIARCHLQYGN